MEIHDLVVRWPGSYHDSFIFSGNHANKYFSQSIDHGILLGD